MFITKKRHEEAMKSLRGENDSLTKENHRLTNNARLDREAIEKQAKCITELRAEIARLTPLAAKHEAKLARDRGRDRRKGAAKKPTPAKPLVAAAPAKKPRTPRTPQ